MRILLLFAIIVVAACDPQSGTARRGVANFIPTPTPERTATPAEAPIDPADVVNVDIMQTGPTLSVNRAPVVNTLDCNKYNRASVNVSGRTITIKGACSQVMVNGDKNDISIAAVMEIVVNGSENTIRYSKYPNGKRPIIDDNGSGNTVEKAAPAPPQK